jgi:TonB family protein
MKIKPLLSIVLCCTLISAKAQSWGDSTKLIKPIFYSAEINPTFPGGLKAYYQFLADNLHMPAKSFLTHYNRLVTVRIFINTEGKIAYATIVNSVNEYYDKEALNVIKNMPSWSPATQNGRAVSFTLEIPILFVD